MKTQNIYKKAEGTTINQIAAYAVCKRLIKNVTARATRASFFHVLVNEIKNLFVYDRLCINLYDSEREVLSLFTAAEGTVVSTLSKARMLKGTVAELVISTRKPVVLDDINQYFPRTQIHPLSEAGLKSTIAVPLMLGKEILGTLHCSFASPPSDMITILSFLMELSPVLALCLFTVLAEERLSTVGVQRAIPIHPVPTHEKKQFFNARGIREVMELVKKIAPLNVPVLITGETGTGKSMLARYIHEQSKRNSANFVKVNCPSLSPTLFESEFFGHAKGAFTGAHAKRIGRIEMAHEGTLFLDEIAELSIEMQSKLLQVLDEQSFERVGESTPVSVDMRLISATNVAIEEALASRCLRQDLYYRLAAVVIFMPPLRQRMEDLEDLIASIILQQAKNFGTEPLVLPSAVLAELRAYQWPGNLRELRNVINRILIHNLTGPLTAKTAHEILYSPEQRVQARAHFSAQPVPTTLKETPVPAADTLAVFENLTARELERKHIEAILQQTEGVLSGPHGAAVRLGLPRTTLQYRMRKLGILRSQ